MKFALKIGSFFFFARLQWVLKMKIKNRGVIEDFKKIKEKIKKEKMFFN